MFVVVVVSGLCVAVRELRQAKMQLWTHDRCSEQRFWHRLVRNDSQLCAGYTTGYITACSVRTLDTVSVMS